MNVLYLLYSKKNKTIYSNPFLGMSWYEDRFTISTSLHWKSRQEAKAAANALPYWNLFEAKLMQCTGTKDYPFNIILEIPSGIPFYKPEFPSVEVIAFLKQKFSELPPDCGYRVTISSIDHEKFVPMLKCYLASDNDV